jgi:hypothetical protein
MIAQVTNSWILAELVGGPYDGGLVVALERTRVIRRPIRLGPEIIAKGFAYPEPQIAEYVRGEGSMQCMAAGADLTVESEELQSLVRRELSRRTTLFTYEGTT